MSYPDISTHGVIPYELVGLANQKKKSSKNTSLNYFYILDDNSQQQYSQQHIPNNEVVINKGDSNQKI